MDLYAGPFTDELVVGTFVDVLKASPAADVVDEDAIELSAPALDILQKPLQPVPPCEAQSAPAHVRVGGHQLDAPACRVGGDRSGLVLDRISLVIGGHSKILSSASCLLGELNQQWVSRISAPNANGAIG